MLKLISVICLLFIELSSVYAGCHDTTLTLQEPQVQGEDTRNITMRISCRGDKIYLPERTLLQFMWQEPSTGQVCYQDRTCGNVEAWGAYFQVGVQWVWYDSFSEYFSGYDYSSRVWQHRIEEQVGVIDLTVGLEFETIERSCSQAGPQICL